MTPSSSNSLQEQHDRLPSLLRGVALSVQLIMGFTLAYLALYCPNAEKEPIDSALLVPYLGACLWLALMTFFFPTFYLRSLLRRLAEPDSPDRTDFLKKGTTHRQAQIRTKVLLAYTGCWTVCAAITTLGFILSIISGNLIYFSIAGATGMFLTIHHRFSYGATIAWVERTTRRPETEKVP